MTKNFIIFITAVFLSCNKHRSTLQINFTSRNFDTFQEIKSFNLTSIEQVNKQRQFFDIESFRPNSFMIRRLDNGLYVGLLTIEKAGTVYNINIDSILINDGNNIITKELNLGTMKLPN